VLVFPATCFSLYFQIILLELVWDTWVVNECVHIHLRNKVAKEETELLLVLGNA
jgi:hypothetical protein